MVGGDRPDHFRPAHIGWRTLIDGAPDRFQHHISGMEHRALVAVIEGHRAERPLHHHLAETDVAGLQGDVRHPVHRHAR